MACLICTGLLGTCRADAWGFTERELQVLALVGAGHSNAAIGVCLGMSERTAQSHVRHLMAKSGTSSRTQLAVCALRRGVLALDRCGCHASHSDHHQAGGMPS